jgi:hypothetical protein
MSYNTDIVVIKPFMMNDKDVAPHQAMFNFPYGTAYVLANYSHICTALLGFFPATTKLSNFGRVQKLNPIT